MKKIVVIFLAIFASLVIVNGQKYDIGVYSEFNVGTTLGQLRAIPIVYDKQKQEGLLLIFGEDQPVDAFMGMFFYPKATLKMAMYTVTGELIWKKELHKGNIPGEWFNPVFPFDLNKDGKEEIWFVYNTDSVHPLDIKKYVLACLDPLTGEMTATYPWHGLDYADYTMSQRYRHFIFGGYDNGTPVLVTAQGTYTKMQLQGWNTDMTKKWDLNIEKDDIGSRSSHSCAIVDIDNDGSDEFMYGERCINVGTGKHKFIADEHVYNGHSDVVAPIMNYADNKWYIFTARETGYGNYAPPRVVMYKDNGQRLWSDLEIGHMDMGYSARLGEKGEHICFSVKIEGKSAGPEGFFRTETEEYIWEPFTGKRITKTFALYEYLPVDINGDGIHELIGSGNQVDGKLKNHNGKEIADFGDAAAAAIVSKFLPLDGEQILLYYPDGKIKIIFDKNAKDNELAKKRYSNPNYIRNQKLTGVGYNLYLLGGF